MASVYVTSLMGRMKCFVVVIIFLLLFLSILMLVPSASFDYLDIPLSISNFRSPQVAHLVNYDPPLHEPPIQGQVRYLKSHRIALVPDIIKEKMLLVYLADFRERILMNLNRSKYVLDVKIDSEVARHSLESCDDLCKTVPDSIETDKMRRAYEKPQSKLKIPKSVIQDPDSLFKHFHGYRDGGAWAPHRCANNAGVAIIFPFRDRWPQLAVTLSVLIQILRRQRLCYRLFVVEQAGMQSFNKGALNNAGFLEARRLFKFKCVIFHDADLIPENARIPYGCDDVRPRMAVHMAWSVNVFGYKLLYDTLVGGVLKVTTEHYISVNGFSNLFWRWGGEDDDIETRMKSQYRRREKYMSRYFAQHHSFVASKYIGSWRHSVFFKTAVSRKSWDGLNSVNYTLLSTHHGPLFTRLIIDVGIRPPEL